MIMLIKTLNGDLFQTDEVDIPTLIRLIGLEVPPSSVKLIVNSDPEDIVTHFLLVETLSIEVPKRLFDRPMSFKQSFWSVCTHPVLIDFVLCSQRLADFPFVFANPHPKMVEGIMQYLNVNVNDNHMNRDVRRELNRNPNPIIIEWVISHPCIIDVEEMWHNPNPLGLRLLGDDKVTTQQKWRSLHYVNYEKYDPNGQWFDHVFNTAEPKYQKIFDLPFISEHSVRIPQLADILLEHFDKLCDTSYHLGYCTDTRVLELILSKCNHSNTYSWALLTNPADIVVNKLCTVDNILHRNYAFALNPHPLAVKYWADRIEHVQFPWMYFMRNPNNDAIELTLHWLKSGETRQKLKEILKRYPETVRNPNPKFLAGILDTFSTFLSEQERDQVVLWFLQVVGDAVSIHLV